MEQEKKITINDIIVARRKEIEAFKVKIDDDPTNKSLAILYRQRSLVKSWAERCTSIFMETIKYKTHYEKRLDDAKSNYNSKIKELLVSDEEVKSQKSSELREASAEQKSGDLTIKFKKARQSFIVIEGFFQEITNKLRDLYKTLEAIDAQDKSIKTMIFIGEIKQKNSGGAIKSKFLEKEIENELAD